MQRTRKFTLPILIIMLFLMATPLVANSVYAESAGGATGGMTDGQGSQDTAGDDGAGNSATLEMIKDIVDTVQLKDSKTTKANLLLSFNGEKGSVNRTMYNASNKIMTGASKPIAYSILAIFLLIELISVTTRQNMGDVLPIPYKVMFKAVICKTVLDMTPTILKAIYGITLMISKAVTSGAGQTVTQADLSKISDTLGSSTGIFHSFVLVLEVFLIWLIVKVCFILVSAIAIGRIIELYLMFAVAPIPLATLPSQEMSGIGKNFLKSFMAVSLQGTLILIILAFFPMLTKGMVMSPSGVGDLFTFVLYSVVLTMCVISSQKLAKSIFNAM